MNFLYLIYRIIFLLFAFFLPDIAKPLYCYIKRKLNNTYECPHWSCKKFFTCYYNQKTLLDFKHSKRYHDLLWYIITFVFIIIFTIIFTFIEVLIWL